MVCPLCLLLLPIFYSLGNSICSAFKIYLEFDTSLHLHHHNSSPGQYPPTCICTITFLQTSPLGPFSAQSILDQNTIQLEIQQWQLIILQVKAKVLPRLCKTRSPLTSLFKSICLFVLLPPCWPSCYSQRQVSFGLRVLALAVLFDRLLFPHISTCFTHSPPSAFSLHVISTVRRLKIVNIYSLYTQIFLFHSFALFFSTGVTRSRFYLSMMLVF